MKEKTLIWLCDNSYLIIQYLFYLGLFVIVGIRFFDIGMSKIVAYLFWLLLGMYLGYAAALGAIEYMHKKGRRFSQWKNKQNDKNPD